MRPYIKVLIVFVIVAGVSALSVAPDTASGSTSGMASRSLYLSNCARCHGADGRADTESGRLYDVPDISGGRLRRKSNRRLTSTIKKGGGSMPAFGKKLNAKQVASLVAYVRGL
jgi:mono/diheme cytochrome c family protein